MEKQKERRRPFITGEESKELERIATSVVNLLRKERIPIWKAKSVLDVAIELLECEILQEE